MADIGLLVGGTLGMLLLVNIFRLVAGVTFGTWRHVLAAYLAGAIAVTFISAVLGAPLSGIPDFSPALFYWLGAVIAAILEWLLIRKRQVA